MLRHLSIHNIVLIERLDLSFNRGMNVLTGETGAGKSILLGALAFATGGRGDAAMVRTGYASGSVVATFEVSPLHPAAEMLCNNDIHCGIDTHYTNFNNEPDSPATASTIVMRRTQFIDGRTRAAINDVPVTVSFMRTISGLLLEIHGQHDDRALISTSFHKKLLDAYGGLEEETKALKQVFASMRNAIDEYESCCNKAADAKREVEFLQKSFDEISKLDPKTGEEQLLAAQRIELVAASKETSFLQNALQELSGTNSPSSIIDNILRRLTRRNSAMHNFDSVTLNLSEALERIEIACAHLESIAKNSAGAPQSLEAIEDRLFSLRAAARKFRVSVDELSALGNKMNHDLNCIQQLDANILFWQSEVDRTTTDYLARARALSMSRKQAALALECAVHQELPALRLSHARLIVSVQESHSSEDGIDSVEFLGQMNPGTKEAPIAKIASGGEMSRLLLALKVALAAKGSAPTLIFDEIDSGTGGAVAEAIGVRLQLLAHEVQVLCITHSPSVAAKASTHMRISKEITGDDRTKIIVDVLDRAGRHSEIARMLSGVEITDEALAVSAKMLDCK